jgi:hypothetical protein
VAVTPTGRVTGAQNTTYPGCTSRARSYTYRFTQTLGLLLKGVQNTPQARPLVLLDRSFALEVAAGWKVQQSWFAPGGLLYRAKAEANSSSQCC